jgi:hypothetical protein
MADEHSGRRLFIRSFSRARTYARLHEECPLLLSDLNKHWNCGLKSAKFPSIQIIDSPFSDSQVVKCQQLDWLYEHADIVRLVVAGHADRMRLYLLTAATNKPFVHATSDIWVWSTMAEWQWQGKAEKTSSSATFSTKILHGLTRTRTRASAVRCRWLTAWVMARDMLALFCNF